MIASGTIRSTQSTDREISDLSSLQEQSEIITKEDIYTDLLVRGYEYGECYNLIRGLSSSCSNGTLTWNEDWPLLLEGLFQVHIFSSNNRKILMPNIIQKIVVDMGQYTEDIKKMNCESSEISSIVSYNLVKNDVYITDYFFFFFSITDEIRQMHQRNNLSRNCCEWC